MNWFAESVSAMIQNFVQQIQKPLETLKRLSEHFAFGCVGIGFSARYVVRFKVEADITLFLMSSIFLTILICDS